MANRIHWAPPETFKKLLFGPIQLNGYSIVKSVETVSQLSPFSKKKEAVYLA
jgi:hypothetical protein